MAGTYKTSYKMYSAWNYQKEIEELNKASEHGWQLVKSSGFHSRFVKNPDIRYRYQLDYRKVDDMGRYIEMFREQGWEYVNSTFNGWHYFRKIYDPALPGEAYEIFTDRESLHEMNTRWARLALIIGVLLGIMAVLCGFRMILKPHLPALVQFLTAFVESAVILRGAYIMFRPDSSRNRNGDSLFVGIFLAVIILGSAAGIVLTELRPHFSSRQQAYSISEPIEDNRWLVFDVRYPDNYYLDLDFRADAPLTFEIVDEAGGTVYSRTDTYFHEEDIRIRLPKGTYWLSMSCETGFQLDVDMR